MIGEKIYKNNFSREKYIELVIWCNKNNAHIEDIGDCYEVVENVIPQLPLQEKLEQLEAKYNMPRVIREIILANPDAYSQFNVLRAKELEKLAKEIRRKTNVQS